MAHVQHNTTCVSATQTQKATTGDLTPWRESLQLIEKTNLTLTQIGLE